MRADGKLDIGAPGFDTDLPNDGKGSVAHALVFAIREGLGRGDRDAVPGMDAHGVEILDRTDNDAVIGVIAHDLHLVLLPAEKGFLDQDFRGGGGVESRGGKLFKLLAVVGHPTAGSAKGKGGADDQGKGADFGRPGTGFFQGVGGGRTGAFQANFGHTVLEELAVFALADGFDLGANEFDLMPLEGARFMEGHGGIEGRLAPQGGKKGVGLFLREDELDDFRGDGLDIGPVGKLGVRHDGGGVAVDQDNAVALLSEGLASLDAGVVKFAGLADDDGAGTDDQNRFYVGPAWHGVINLKGWRGRLEEGDRLGLGLRLSKFGMTAAPEHGPTGV